MTPRIIYAVLAVLALAVPAGAQVPPIVDEDDSPSSTFFRSLSPGAVLRPPSRSHNAPRPQPRRGPMPPDKDSDASPSYLNIIIDEPGAEGVLPPPERLPRRTTPAVSPRPVDRTAAVPPKPEPLPKPRPDANIESMPLPSPSPAEAKPQPAGLPMPPIPPRSGNATRPHPRGEPMPPGKDGDAAALPRPKANTDEANQDGVLPPPPDRLPRRAVPTVPVKPVDRSAAVPPKPEPLPKPRPDAKIESMPLPSPSPAEAKRQPASLPMPPGKDGDPAALSRPKANTDESNRDDLLPPPPERLPRRAVPAVPVKPVDRTAAVPPKPEPLPKPRPDAKIESMPLPSPSPPVVPARRPVSAPMLLTPPSVSNAAPQLRGGTTQPNKSGNASAPSATNVIMADPDPDDILPAPENASGNALHILH